MAACPLYSAVGRGYATTIAGLQQRTVPGRVSRLPVPAHRAVWRHWYFRKVLKIIRNASGVVFKKNAAKEKRNARQRKYSFSSLITPSVGASFHPAKHPPCSDTAVPALGIPAMRGVPCSVPALGSQVSHMLSQ